MAKTTAAHSFRSRPRPRRSPGVPARRRRWASTVACTACACAILPTAVASAQTQTVAEGLIGQGLVRDATVPTNTRDIYPDLASGNTVMVVTPGTDDTLLFPRILPLVGRRSVLVVQYPESLGPFIGGKSGAVLPMLAPAYDQSRRVAIDRNLRVMTAYAADRVHGPRVVYTAYSQGADALGNALEIAQRSGVDLGNSRVILAADPRSPWGVKSWLKGSPLETTLGAMGVAADGARDPGATEQVPITSVIIVGDPAADFQWDPLRPVSSMLVNGAGFLTIHAGKGSQNYGTLDRLGAPTVLASDDGATTYHVYDAIHPLAQVVEFAYRTVGIPYRTKDVDRWDADAGTFYPLQRPEVGNAKTPVVTPRHHHPRTTPKSPPVIGSGPMRTAPVPAVAGARLHPGALREAEPGGGAGSDDRRRQSLPERTSPRAVRDHLDDGEKHR